MLMRWLQFPPVLSLSGVEKAAPFAEDRSSNSPNRLGDPKPLISRR